MAVLYSHTFETPDGSGALPAWYNLLGLSPTEGSTHAVVATVKVMLSDSPAGTYNMKCKLKAYGGGDTAYSYEDVTWAGEPTQIITFTFVGGVNAAITGNKFEVYVAKNSGPGFTTYASTEDGDPYFVVEGEWAGMPTAPEKPTNPTPTNADTEVDFSGLGLSWDDGGDADTFDVYIGPSGSLVKVSDAQVPTSFGVDLEDVPTNQVIYWRVDATNDVGTTTGDTWHFDARPAQVSTFVPANEATGITLHSTSGTWESPSDNADSYNVYYGTLSGFLSLLGNTADLTYTLRATNWPSYGAVHYWRVDAVNDFGTTQGDELYFTNLIYYPPLPSYDLINGSEDGPPGSGAGTEEGVEGEDYAWTGENNVITVKRLVTVANNNKVFFGSI